jgi:putative FmdB family regulatory protein
MPIYEYRCSACGHELESIQKFSDAPLVACPSCKADALVKKVSAAGFQLKGSGWYATDFRNGSKPAETKKSTAAPAAESAGGDAKPAAAKAESAPAAAPAASTPATPATTPSSGSST